MKQIAKAYEPQKIEKELYKHWEDAGYFKPEIHPDGEPFCIIMPPPNANGSLHLGHAVFVTLEDIMTRYARLCGKAALWLPGADHAGFETQVVYEKKLDKEGRNRFEMSRDQLYKETLDFTLKNKAFMESQLRELGASCDWSREKFTLDPDIIKTVYTTFKNLYDDGLVYRDSRPVNWCTKHQTSFSDLEVKYEERIDPLYYLKYQIVKTKDQKLKTKEIIVATVRPETMFGDTAVAVNATDKQYKDLIGSKVRIPLTDNTVEIIADEMVDPKFGTGAVKITPAHDPNDFEVAKRHNLEIKEVIDKYGRMNDKAGPYKGMKIMEARARVVEDLEKKGLLVKVDEKYSHTVGVCYRCSTVIEPRILPQWFVAVNKKGMKSGKNLAKDAVAAVKKCETKFVTKKFEKIFDHWMSNIRDWNISRQIVWGIQLPVWYRKQDVILSVNEESQGDPSALLQDDNKDVYVGVEPPEDIENWERDLDVLDTWFSSGQWPFATLQGQSSKGQASSKDDFTKFYPTDVMETGWDILFFWVARMIMLGLYTTGKVPFKHVYLHGLVRDKDRQKMSKSKGNVIDPLGVAELYGTDAVRMALVFGVAAGNDIVISEEKIRGMRNFANKIWNASRFVLLRVSDGDLQSGNIGSARIADLKIDEKALTAADKEILKKHAEIIKAATQNIEKYNFSLAGELLYEYFWHVFADSYIEQSKAQLDDKKTNKNTKKILIKVLSDTLIMLHPFMPFVTEAVWKELIIICPELAKSESIMIAKWPQAS